MNFTFTVEVSVERVQGKFAGRDEISERILDEIQGALDNIDLNGIGADSESEYEVADSSVDEQEQPKIRRK